MATTAPNLIVSMADVPLALKTGFGAGMPLFIEGPPGVGKSEIVEQYAEAQGPDYFFGILNAATANLPDVIGVLMPRVEKFIDSNGIERNITVGEYAYPYFLRDKRTRRFASQYTRGVLVIEEYGQASLDMKRGLATVIWNKMAGEHPIPAGFDIIILSNRPEDRSGVGKDYDFLINRRMQFQVKADPAAWTVWAHDHGISNATLAYADRRKTIVFDGKMPEKQGPWMTPRSLVSLDKYYQYAHVQLHVPLEEPFFYKMAASIVGHGGAIDYIAFAGLRDKLPSVAKIIKDPTGTPVPEQPDQQMFLAFDLASVVTRQTMKPVIAYVNRMPKDFSMAFFRSAMQRDKTLRSTTEFGDWATSNLSLLSAIAGS